MEKKPEIELYLYSLNQEFPVNADSSSSTNRKYHRFFDDAGVEVETEQLSTSLQTDPNEVSDKPPKPPRWSIKWIKNWSKTTPYKNKTKSASSLKTKRHPLTTLKIRDEEFGGIAFDPIYDRVYKVNRDGYYLLEKLIADVEVNEFDQNNYSEIDLVYLNKFISFLDEHKLWL